MLVFDSDTLDRRDRSDAMVAAMADATRATRFEHEDLGAKVYLRMERWQLGSTALVHASCSGHTQSRTEHRSDRDDEPIVVIGAQFTGGGVQVQDGAVTRLTPGGVYGMVLTGPYRHVSTGDTRSLNLLVRAGDLELPLKLIAEARPRLDASPVREILRAHMHALAAAADGLDEVSAGLVEPATLRLIRAFLASVSTSERHVQEALVDTLVARVRTFIRRQLQDPNLSATTIAAAHHVSERQLYKACAAEQLRLGQWIIAQRLAAACDELASPVGRRHTIAATAAKWGFANSSHFTHRFRAAYGMTPTEWQAVTDDRRPEPNAG